MPYAMRSNFRAPYVGADPGVGDFSPFDFVWNSLSDGSGAAATNTGQLADALIKAGLSVATISALLNQVSTVAGATPKMLQQAQLEQQWIAQYGQRTNWVPILVIGGLLLWAVSQSKE